MNQVPSIFSRAGVRQIGVDVLSGMGAGQHPRLSIRGQMFHLVDAAGSRYPAPIQLFGQVPTLQCIIVGANPTMSKVYFEQDYDPDSSIPPTCYSDNGIAPSRNASQKMARTCAECELSAWGSAVSRMTGKGVKACVDKKKLAILVVGDTTGLIYEFQVPPASLKALGAYAGKLSSITVPDGSGRRAEPSDFVTGIQFVPDRTGELQFTPLCWLDSVGHDGVKTFIVFDPAGNPATSPDGGLAIASIVDAAWDSGQVEEVTGAKDQPWGGTALPAPERPQAYLEAQPQGGALQRGSHPAQQAPMTPSQVAAAPTPQNPYAGPAGQPASQPIQAFTPAAPRAPVPAAPQPVRGAARAPAAPQPTGQVVPMTPARGQVEEEDVPAFLKRARATAPQTATVEVPQAAPVPASPAPAPANFGMTNPPPPPGDIGAAIRQAMTLKTGQ